MRTTMRKICQTFAIAGLLMVLPLAAQAASGIDELQGNLGTLGKNTGLGNETSDLKGTVANIINIVLGFLGIIAVIMVLMGGFKWMMAGGNEDEVKQARERIKNAVIGLVIVFASYIITNFAVNQLSDATGAGGGGGNPGQVAQPAAGG